MSFLWSSVLCLYSAALLRDMASVLHGRGLSLDNSGKFCARSRVTQKRCAVSVAGIAVSFL